MHTGNLNVFKERGFKRRQTAGPVAEAVARQARAGRAGPRGDQFVVAAPIIWKEITTAFKGRMTGASYTVENGIVRVRTPLGEKVAELGGANVVWVAWRLVREMASEGKA